MRPIRPWGAVLLALLGSARAEDRWTDPYPGVRHLSRTDRYPYDDRPPYRMEAVVIDLTHPAVSIVATPPDQAGGTVSRFADRAGAQVAWNTNFFGSPQDACGLMMGDGRVWDRAYQDGCHASIGFGDENQAAIFVQGDPHGPPPEGWMRQVATGKPGPILVGGQPQFRYGCGAPCAYHPRTGIGLDRERRTLYVVVVDGRQDGTVGAGLDDLANLMRDLGAWDAVNLDGGGSSTLFIRGEGGVVNRPSDGRERDVCCHMGVRIDPSAAWWRAERVDQSPAGGPFGPGDRAELWVRYLNTGRRTWRPDGDHPVRLGTRDPQDRESPWRGPGWIDGDRAAAVEAVTGPGAEGTFRFEIVAPAPGRYDEAFAPVAEGAAWMDAPVRWTLEVVAREVPPRPDAGAPDAGRPDARVADTASPPSEAGNRDAAAPHPPSDEDGGGPTYPPPRRTADAGGDAVPGARARGAHLDGGCAVPGGGGSGPLALVLLALARRRCARR